MYTVKGRQVYGNCVHVGHAHGKGQIKAWIMNSYIVDDSNFLLSLLQENRDQEVDIVYNKIEQNLNLMGCTAIEDKLQDGVPETIANLAKVNLQQLTLFM